MSEASPALVAWILGLPGLVGPLALLLVGAVIVGVLSEALLGISEALTRPTRHARPTPPTQGHEEAPE